MDPLNPHLDDRVLQALACGEQSPQDVLDGHAHLAGCKACEQALRRWEVLVAGLEQLPLREPGPAFEEAILARLVPQSPRGAALRHLAPEGIQRHLMGELNPEQSAGAVAHLAHCPSCREEAARWHTLFGGLGTLPSVSPTAAFEDRVMVRVPVGAIARAFAAQQRPWSERLLTRVQRWVPRTGRGWALLGGASILPATAPILLILFFLANPAVSLRDLLLFVQWQLFRLGDGLGARWLQSWGGGSASWGLETLWAGLQRLPTEGLILAFFLSALIIATSAVILVRSLLLPAPRGRSHAS
jgi:anti-sigma factor RsiW